MRKIFIIFMVAQLGFSAVLRGQDPDAKGIINNNFSTPSPNAASIVKKSSANVSMFTGSASVDIPLYEIRYRDLSIPIGLSYYYNGFKPNEHPSWTGLGWTLNAGGSIIRVKKGEVDEIQVYNTTKDYSYINAYNGYFAAQDDIIPSCYVGMRDMTPTGLEDVFPIVYDPEPDEFLFNFMGYSGKFIYDNRFGSKGFKVQSGQGVEFDISYQIDSNYYFPSTGELHGYQILKRYIRLFTLTAKDGTKYLFGATEYPTDTSGVEFTVGGPNTKYGSANQYELGNNMHVTAWHLIRIITPLGTEAVFSYDTYGHTVDVFPAFELQGMRAGPVDAKQTNYKQYGVSVTYARYLKSIEMGPEKLEFESSSTRHKIYDPLGAVDTLREEIIPDYKNLLSKEVKKYMCDWFGMIREQAPEPAEYVFETVYRKLNSISWKHDGILVSKQHLKYNDTAGLKSQTGRLELAFLSETDYSGTKQKGNYSFTYYPLNPGGTGISTFSEYAPLSYGTKKVDHWGYYTGNPEISLLVGDTSSINPNLDFGIIHNNYRSSRDVGVAPGAYTKAMAGALKTIKYPTGGTTKFEYEPNIYSKYPDYDPYDDSLIIRTRPADEVCGGIRVKSITNYSSTDSNSVGLNIDGPPIVLEYKYKENYNVNGESARSSGMLNAGLPYYIETASTPMIFNTGPMNHPAYDSLPNGYCGPSQYFYWTNTNALMPEVQGGHVLYSQVTQVAGDGSYKTYKYSNWDNYAGAKDELPNKTGVFNSLEQPCLFPGSPRLSLKDSNSIAIAGIKRQARISHHLERGLLLEEAVYHSGNQLKAKTVYKYNDDPARYNEYVPFVRVLSRRLPNSTYNSTYLLKQYRSRFYTYYPYLKEVKTYYYGSGAVDTSREIYAYDAERNLVAKGVHIGNGTLKIDSFIYSGSPSLHLDPDITYADPFAEGLKNLKTLGIKNALVEQITKLREPAGTKILQSVLFRYQAGLPAVDQKYTTEFSVPVAAAAFAPVKMVGLTCNVDPAYKLLETYENSPAGNKTAIVHQNSNRKSAFIYGSLDQLPIAQITNAAPAECSYTSFERVITNEYDFGNWYYVTSSVIPTDALTGSKCYDLSGSLVRTNYNNLISGKQYIISFWTKGGSFTVSNGAEILSGFTQGPNLNGWNYYQIKFTSGGEIVKITGNALIDELRLFPADAQMTSNTYNLYGKPTSVTFPNGNVELYEYDSTGRLKIVRDTRGNIIKSYEYGISKTE